MSELNAYNRIAAAIVSFLRLCQLNKDQGLIALERARGWFVEQFYGSSTDDMIRASGYYTLVALNSYTEADQWRDDCPSREAVTRDALGRMPMLIKSDLEITQVPGAYQYPSWIWQDGKWMPIKIITGIPLQPGAYGGTNRIS